MLPGLKANAEAIDGITIRQGASSSRFNATGDSGTAPPRPTTPSNGIAFGNFGATGPA